MAASHNGRHRSASLKRPAVPHLTTPTIISIPTPPAPTNADADSENDNDTAPLLIDSEVQAGLSSAPVVRRRPVLSRRKTSKKEYVHPYLSGNFSSVTTECPLTDCLFEGTIPAELAGSQYVRNGGNPLANSELDRDAHWFDADGMLAGVLFRRTSDGTIQPCFLNRFILTDLLLSTPEHARLPMLPSIATLVNPHTSLFWLMVEIMRTFVLAMLTWLPGLGLESGQKLRRISAANTTVYWHDGKAMAGCESGPPMRIMLPGLETVGWYTGEDEVEVEAEGNEKGSAKKTTKSKGFGGGPPIISMLREFTTAHPRIDPKTQELLLYHMCFEPPYLRVSVIPPTAVADRAALPADAKTIKGQAVKGLKQSKMMHDFGATFTHTIIIDVPLSLDMLNLVRGKPILHYDPSQPSRFGVMPRYEPGKVRWFESPEACCVYHTANSWDDDDGSLLFGEGDGAAKTTRGINMLGCRLNSATLVYSAGNLLPPSHVLPPPNCPEKCQLYYWRFDLEDSERNTISHEFALSDVPFEFPAINEEYGMQEARYVYGTSMRDGTFDAGLGKAAKIDALVKIDAQTLIRKGKSMWSQGRLKAGDSVDTRTVEQVLAAQRDGSADEKDVIKIFEMPQGWYAQEATFVPRRATQSGQQMEEDDGWLICYVFDEATGLHPSTGEVLPGATSELWIIDAKNMKDVVCRVKLPQRVPYGLHGTLFTEEQIASQKPIDPSQVRTWASSVNHADPFVSTSLGSTMCSASGKQATSKFKDGMAVYNAFLKDPIRIGAWWIKRNVEFLIA